ncbi:protein piccolo isoform X2 [Austrofundulus limnaeus]|uniref:Protein piccolo isoform X2 n=1 Tax=Austrofundulus limnaeus TaxID=52670 RepID=A0A2I4C2H1_AUSLI|nr:PREDICTED: protein piccolo-like isoform X2 [Austrofundulus limnaeus]
MYRGYLFACCCVFTASQVAGENLIYALLGKTACFNTDIKTPPDKILWTHNKNKLVEFNGHTEEVFGSFKDRISMDWHSADLNISTARYEDSGLYELETNTKTVLQRAQYNLEVIDKVPKPNIYCEMMKGNGSGESGHKATLMCSAEQSQSLLTFTWSPSLNGQLGPKLIIPLGDENDNEEYSCTVHNPLSEESAIFIAKKCYSDENISVPVIVGICVGCVVALILIIVGILLCRKGETTYDLEKQKPCEITEGAGNGDLETAGLLDRAPTLPSNQRLSHLVRNNKGSHLTQDAPYMNELRMSIHKRPGAENKNQDLSTLSSPSPEKPSRSQDLSAEAKDQTDGETVEVILELEPADSGKINDAMSKQGTLPLAPEQPPHQDPAEPADEDELREAVEKVLPVLEKSTKKRAPNPPPVAKKTASVNNEKTQVDENKPPEETKDLPDQNSGEEDKVTESETPLSPSLLPETKSPVPESPVPQSPDPQSSDSQPPVPELSDPMSPICKPPVPLPRSCLNPTFPKNEHKEDPSPDQVAGKPETQNSKESGLLGSGEESERPTISSESTGTVTTHEQQPPVTETNQKEETLQENNKQGPGENPKPNGEGDQEGIDPHFNTLKEHQSLESSKPDNIKVDTSPEPPDAAQASPDDKNQDKTRHSSHSETGPETEDKSDTAEGKNKDQP